MRFVRAFIPFALAGLAVGCGSGSDDSSGGAGTTTPAAPVADLRADTNRDGKVDLDGDTDKEGKATWTPKAGAVFLANIDDDQGACTVPSGTADADLPACNDAADDVVNGDADLEDLARLHVKPWAAAPADAKATVTVDAAGAPNVRLFKKTADGFVVVDAEGVLTTDELKNGIELAIEAKDIARDLDAWNGLATVTLKVTGNGQTKEDSVQLRVAPVLLSHHLWKAEKVYVTKIGGTESSQFRAGVKKAADTAGIPVQEISVSDQWTQDFFETGFMAMPKEGGAKVIRVALRSANVQGSGKFPLRSAGRVVFSMLRGPDFAGIQAYDLKHSQDMDSLNSYGNTETIPPHTFGGKTYPLGRVVRGSIPSFFPDPIMAKLLAAQQVQPLVPIDTSWLLVGHVDESISFVKAKNERGWVLLAGDPLGAVKILQDAVAAGKGDVTMFQGKAFIDSKGQDIPAEISIAKALDDKNVMAATMSAATRIDDQLATLKKEVGITDADIVRIPFLFTKDFGFHIAYQPGMVNGLYAADDVFGSPDPHGPVVDGKDIFKTATETALAPHGVNVVWIEDWDLYHALDGEVHCGTNSLRAVPPEATRWWEAL